MADEPGDADPYDPTDPDDDASEPNEFTPTVPPPPPPTAAAPQPVYIAPTTYAQPPPGPVAQAPPPAQPVYVQPTSYMPPPQPNYNQAPPPPQQVYTHPPPPQQVYTQPYPPQPVYSQPPQQNVYTQSPSPQAYTQTSLRPSSQSSQGTVRLRPTYANKYVETEDDYDDDEDEEKSLVSAGNSLPQTSVSGSLINLHPTRNGFLLKFYQIATLQGRVSYLLMSIYVINAAVYNNWFGGTVLYPYLLANMVYGYTFVLFTRIHFMTMPGLPRILFSFLGSMMFSYASCVTFHWIADNWGGKSSHPRVMIATILSVLYGRMYAGALLSYLNYVDKKILSLVRRIYGPYIFDI